MSFVVFRLDSLGDVVLTTPIFRELKRCFPGSRCTVVVTESYRSLVATNPYVDEIFTVTRLRVRWLPERAERLLAAILLWWRHLKGKEYDVAISPRWDADEHLATLLCLLTNAGMRVGYTEQASAAKRRLNRGFDGTFDLCLSAGPSLHEVLRNLRLVEALGGIVKDMSLDIWLTARDRRHAAKILRNVNPSATLVALGIGAQSAGRCWPLERYAQTIASLEKLFAVQPVVICSPAERNQVSALAPLLRVEPIVVCRPQLREVCAVLEHCDLFIGNDSGPAHLAAAMDRKVVVISRHPSQGDPDHPNSPERFAPYCRERRIVQPEWPLGDCSSSCHVSQPHCINAVSVEEVVAAAHELLAHPAGNSCEPVSSTLPHLGLAETYAAVTQGAL